MPLLWHGTLGLPVVFQARQDKYNTPKKEDDKKEICKECSEFEIVFPLTRPVLDKKPWKSYALTWDESFPFPIVQSSPHGKFQGFGHAPWRERCEGLHGTTLKSSADNRPVTSTACVVVVSMLFSSPDFSPVPCRAVEEEGGRLGGL